MAVEVWLVEEVAGERESDKRITENALCKIKMKALASRETM